MNKFSSLLFLILLIVALSSSLSSMIYESGVFYQFLMGHETGSDYDNWVSHVSEGVVIPGFNAYPPWDRQTNGFGAFTLPNPTQIQQWNLICDYFVNQQWDQLEQELAESNLPYDLVSFFDTETNRTYYMLRERLDDTYYDDNGTPETDDDEFGSFNLGWGLAVFNPEAINPIVIMVPHPNDDYISVPLACRAFTQLDARFLFVNGAGREVMWTGTGVYTNSQSISDPSRYSGHPLHKAYMKSCDEIRTLLSNSPSIIKREFSLQTHSYDTNMHIGYPSCQVSAGNGEICPNLPIRDLSQTLTDIINAAPYIIHAANTIGNNAEVTTNYFWGVNYSVHPFDFDDGVNQIPVSNQVDLPGYGYNNQMLYSIAGWNNYDVYDPFFHIEMDELPNCYPQNDSLLAWFYGWDYVTQTWNFADRYIKVMQYYQPWIDALHTSLYHTLVMNDGLAPEMTEIIEATIINTNVLRLNWLRSYEYDFDTWIMSLVRRTYQGGGVYTIVDTLIFDRNNVIALADQALDLIEMENIPLGYHYIFKMAARDKSNRMSDYTAPINLITYASDPAVTNLSYISQQSDASHISITWTQVPADVLIDGYRIDRRVAGSTIWESIATLPDNAFQYTDGDFPLADSLVYNYRVTVLGANQQVFVPTSYCTGYLRIYQAPQISSFDFSTSLINIHWDNVTTTLSGHSDTPDYYLVTKSNSLDFSGPDTQTFSVYTTMFTDTYSAASPYAEKCFYKVTAMAAPIGSR